MKIISELTTEELHERILHATTELIEREAAKKFEAGMDAIARVTASVDGSEELKAGDKVKFLGPSEEFNNDVTVGKVYEIYKIDGDNHACFKDEVTSSFISPKYRHLFEKVDEPLIELQDDPTEEPVPIKSANQQRAEINQRAREFVDGYKDNINLFGTYACDAVFKVNRQKRTVTCMLVGQGTGYVRKRATTKCHPNEVFNEDIGKAISLCLVRQIDIPQEFIDAVQPDEVVAGMKVIYDDEKSRGLLTVISNNHGGIYPPHETKLLVAETPPTTIIDDTNAEYGEV